MNISPISILHVEDNPADAFFVNDALINNQDPFQFQLIQAKSLAETITCLSKNKYDIILLDLSLPDSTGLDTFLKVHNLNLDLPIIVLSGLAESTITLEAVRQGAQDYLTKDSISNYLLPRVILYAIERNRAKQALQHSELKYRSLIENLPIGILEIDLDGHITAVNPASLELYAIEKSKKNWIGSSYLYFFELKDRAQAQMIFTATLQGKLQESEFRLKINNFQHICLFQFNPIKTSDQSIAKILVIIQDITDRKKFENMLKEAKSYAEKIANEKIRELQEANQKIQNSKRLSDIGMLAATVAHELRNPLGVIRTAAYNIKCKSRNADLNSHLENIDKKIQESDQIINNLLSYANIKTPSYKTVLVYNLLDECLSQIQEKYHQWNVMVSKKCDGPKDLTIEADPIQIAELFNNILSNAYEALLNQTGEINISDQVEHNTFCIQFCDNGMGISPEDLEKLTEPFFTKKTKGIGLGLTVCSQIVNLHGGSICFKSQKGKGTQITIHLPITKSSL